MSTRLVSVDELVSIDDIAQRLKMSVNVASNIVRGRDGRHRLKFPKPLVGRGTHAVWLWSDVEEWAASAPKSTNNKKKSANAGTLPYKQPSWSCGRRTA